MKQNEVAYENGVGAYAASSVINFHLNRTIQIF